MEATYTKEQIKAALAEKYRTAYADYFGLEMLSVEALRDGDQDAHAAISKRALLRSQYISGMKDAAKVLGIDEDEFMAAVNSDKEANYAEAEM